MKFNMGATDRISRLVIAAIIAVLYFSHLVTGVLGIALLILAIILVLTGFIGLCPLYILFGINTRKKKYN